MTVLKKEKDTTVTLTEQAEEVLKFKFDLCDYDLISEKALMKHVKMKHQIKQIYRADDSESDSNVESKETEKTHGKYLMKVP